MSADVPPSSAGSPGLNDDTFVYHLQLPVAASGATVLMQAIDFGKPLKETTRRISVVAPSAEHQRGIDFPVLVLDIVVAAPTARALRIATHGFLEQLQLSLRTLEMFAPSVPSHFTSGGGVPSDSPRLSTSSSSSSSRGGGGGSGGFSRGGGGALTSALSKLSGTSPTSNSNNHISNNTKAAAAGFGMMGHPSGSSSSFSGGGIGERSGSFSSSSEHQHQHLSSIGVKPSPMLEPVQPTAVGKDAEQNATTGDFSLA